jgi:hypothetical protein
MHAHEDNGDLNVLVADIGLPSCTPANCGQVVAQVSHTKQRFDWDCGIACTVMALNYLTQAQNITYEEISEKLNGLTSIWTIDLGK